MKYREYSQLSKTISLWTLQERWTKRDLAPAQLATSAQGSLPALDSAFAATRPDLAEKRTCAASGFQSWREASSTLSFISGRAMKRFAKFRRNADYAERYSGTRKNRCCRRTNSLKIKKRGRHTGGKPVPPMPDAACGGTETPAGITIATMPAYLITRLPCQVCNLPRSTGTGDFHRSSVFNWRSPAASRHRCARQRGRGAHERCHCDSLVCSRTRDAHAGNRD